MAAVRTENALRFIDRFATRSIGLFFETPCRAFSELVEAGEAFNTRLKQRLADNPELLESILTDIKTAHQSSQSRDTQKAVGEVKK
jgi:hypothetical protein